MNTYMDLNPPAGLQANEEYELVPFDFSSNRYNPSIEYDITLTQLITEQELRKFIESANTVLSRAEAQAAQTTAGTICWTGFTFIGFFCILVGVIFVLIQLSTDSASTNLVLSITGIVLVYVSLIIFCVLTVQLYRSLAFMGSFSYYTPRIKKLIEQDAKAFESSKVRWALGKRMGGKRKPVDCYDLLYIVWTPQLPNVASDILTENYVKDKELLVTAVQSSDTFNGGSLIHTLKSN